MIATGRFVFLHLHKSGGTFVNECLLRFLPDARRLGYHLPRALIPEELAALPVLGLVRSPWSYYVSWYSFQTARREPNALFRIVSDDGRRDFKATLIELLALGGESSTLEQVVAALPAKYGSRGINLPGFALAPIRGTGLGFYSYLYRYLFGTGPCTIGRMETLREEVPRMLESVGQPVGSEMGEFIARAEPRNAVQHAPYTELFDDELRERVAVHDAPVIERHGYRFGD